MRIYCSKFNILLYQDQVLKQLDYYIVQAKIFSIPNNKWNPSKLDSSITTHGRICYHECPY